MTPRILLPDATPVSLLASLGDEALDWLLAPGLPLWLTDMVIIEITREPDEGADRRKETRAAAADWLRRNRGRYRIENTPEGKAYLAAMQAWEALGRPPAAKPPWANRGELSLRDALNLSVSGALGADEEVILLVDDRPARRLLAQTLEDEGLNGTIMATETFLVWLVEDFGIGAAATAWPAIAIAAGETQPPAPADDPLEIRPT